MLCQLTLIPDNMRSRLIETGICDVLIPLTDSPSLEVQGNSATALANLSTKGTPIVNCISHRS
jgi:vacuolar protein 8